MTRRETQFPSHIGSRSTVVLRILLMVLFMSFHPTLVLAQRELIRGYWNSFKFPSHIGSRSTCLSFILVYVKMFPSHIGSRSTLMGSSWHGTIRGFHPTLVLAQPSIRTVEELQLNKFPSHIGSRSTNNGKLVFPAAFPFPSHIGSRSTCVIYRWKA